MEIQRWLHDRTTGSWLFDALPVFEQPTILSLDAKHQSPYTLIVRGADDVKCLNGIVMVVQEEGLGSSSIPLSFRRTIRHALEAPLDLLHRD
jgi:hypothetical protein